MYRYIFNKNIILLDEGFSNSKTLNELGSSIYLCITEPVSIDRLIFLSLSLSFIMYTYLTTLLFPVNFLFPYNNIL